MKNIKWGLLSFTLLFLLTGCSFTGAPEKSADSEDFAAMYSNWEAEIEMVSQEDDGTDDSLETEENDSVVGSLQDALEYGYITPAHGETVSNDDSTLGTASDNTLQGSLQGKVYTNTYAGFGCDLTGWELYTQAQLQELTDDVATAVNDSSLGDTVDTLLSDRTNFYDMAAKKGLGLQLTYVMYQKITPQTQWLYSTMTNDEIVDISLLMKDTLIEALEQTGATVISLEKVTVEFLGEQRAAVKTVSETDSVTTYQLQVIDHKRGDYSVSVVVTSYYIDSTQELLDMFYPVD